jgi:murein DD-endopeptidase MepM/ murein hydrolase activator NlpD
MNKIILFLTLFALFAPTVRAEVPLELQQAIQEKSKALQTVTQKIQETQKNLSEAENKSSSLKKELSNISYKINQLDLGIKSSEITLEKLDLEIASLQYEINEAETKSIFKKSAIKELLRSLHQKDEESGLIAFLKNKTLASGFLELQGLISLGLNLSNEVEGLALIHEDLSAKLDQQSQKRKAQDEERRTLKSRKNLVEEQKNNRKQLLAQTKELEKIYQYQLDELEKQQEAIFDEITKIEDELRAKFDSNLLPGKRPGVFGWPIKLVKDGGVGRITQHAGEISHLYRGKPHNGLDIGAPIGTPVYAAEDGIVIKVDNNDRSAWKKYQYGKYVMIKHKNNLSTLYAHLSINNVVSEGTYVRRGELIGYSGNTGYSTGPHLHFGLYWSSSVLFKHITPAAGVVPVGVIVYPEDYLPAH